MSRWVFPAFREVLAALPPSMSAADVLRDELRLFDDGRVALYYAPFDYVNEQARVILMGITPGRYQYWKACLVAREGITAQLPDDEVLRRVTESASFSGPMRKHLVTMLDGIGIPESLGLGIAIRCQREASFLNVRRELPRVRPRQELHRVDAAPLGTFRSAERR